MHYSRSELRRSSGTHVSPTPQAAIAVRPQTVPPVFPQPQSQYQGLSEWPPRGYGRDANLSQGKAMEFICTGVPVYKGHKRGIPHAGEEYYQFYATCVGNGHAGSDRAKPAYEPFGAASLRLQGSDTAIYPWETLEQPSMAFCYGMIPGTITLNHWVGLSGNPGPKLGLRDLGVQPREVDLEVILERLVYLEGGFEEDYPDLMYKNLYKNLLRDPDKFMNPHKAMEKQIADLIMVLSRKEWIDFSKPENQVVAKFFANATYTDGRKYKQFFHQLLLSMELDARIHSKQHTAEAKERLLAQLPPCIAWDLALARKWKQCVSIERYKTGADPEQIRLHFRNKKPQVKALRKFARVMKWPNLVKVDDILKGKDPNDGPLEDRSSDAMSYFTGVILPGPTLPWLIMNTIIDCDPDAGGNSLTTLTHIHPHSGFQYKSTTYWSSTSIVGKVIAPTCREIGGWIGPARPAPDLSRIQIARIHQRRPRQILNPDDIDSMTERSDPLGPPSRTYPISEYQLLLPDREPSELVDTVRIEKLALKPVSVTSAPENEQNKDSRRPLTYDAAVQFAIDGQSWPLRLSYDVSFIAACPCAGAGPHPLFFDYVYQAVKVDQILTIKDWGGINSSNSLSTSSARGNSPSPAANGRSGSRNSQLPVSSSATLIDGVAKPAEREDEDDNEKVLAIECFGVEDNEVLARAWCAHWGLSAVVADVERTCMGCAIREAYAACINVVILIEGKNGV
ncbi:hypothetical protein BDZ45DRAFT_582087 [Acephala macrosclerotiorum]|nr:hypothetical protein BDZ45DRAFT_582087 [Acephala macrosclerotiorum]